MSWLKMHFLKIASLLLLVVGVGIIFISIKSAKLENKILLPPFAYSDLAKYGYEYITVSGTLVGSEGGNVAFPLNTNEFVCDNLIKECSLVQAQIVTDSGYLTTYKESFPIESWDNNFVVFKTDPVQSHCSAWTYRIDRLKRELIGVRERSNDYDFDSCLGIGVERFQVKLIDGFEVVSRLRGNKE